MIIVDYLFSIVFVISNVMIIKFFVLIYFSFGDFVGYLLYLIIGGYFLFGVLNSIVIKLIVLIMEFLVNYDKISLNFIFEEMLFNIKMFRFVNRRGVENRIVKLLDIIDYFIMFLVYYNNVEIIL